MANFTLRPATQADFPAIKALIHLVHIHPTGLDWRRFWVAVSPQGELVGCGQIKPQGELRILASIAVLPAWRGRGVARWIIERLLAESQGPLYLTCRLHLEPFYQKFGFTTLALSEMPASLRRLSRFARLLRRLKLLDEEMLVMFRP
jgi:N-acetylglutamate synthase-like GNAT family acetyltransferase